MEKKKKKASLYSFPSSKITNNIMIWLTFPWEAGAENRDKAKATTAGNGKDYMLIMIYFIDWLLPIDLMVD